MTLQDMLLKIEPELSLSRTSNSTIKKRISPL